MNLERIFPRVSSFLFIVGVMALFMEFSVIPIHPAFSTDENIPSEEGHTCPGRPPKLRFAALGFDLGSCKWEVDRLVKKHDREFREWPLEGHPKSIRYFSIDDALIRPPGEEGFTYSSTDFMFLEDVLYLIEGHYGYSKRIWAEQGFTDLDTILKKKYGDGRHDQEHRSSRKKYPYSKVWILEKPGTLIRMYVEKDWLRIKYVDVKMFNLAEQKREGFLLEKSGDGF